MSEQSGALNPISTNPYDKVTNDNIKSALVVDIAIWVFLLSLFVIFQSRSILYKYRLVSPSVTVKPPALPKGVSSLWAWFVATVRTSDQELLDSVGLDALMLVKLFTFGIQLFTPIMVLGVAILVPVHWTGGFLQNDPTYGNQSGFMRLTTTNVAPYSNVLWLHFVMVWIYIFWGCWLLKWHYHQYVTIRQHWLRAGDDVNYWRALLTEQAKEQAQETKMTFANVLSNLPLLKNLLSANQGATSERGSVTPGPATPRPSTPRGRTSSEQPLEHKSSHRGWQVPASPKTSAGQRHGIELAAFVVTDASAAPAVGADDIEGADRHSGLHNRQHEGHTSRPRSGEQSPNAASFRDIKSGLIKDTGVLPQRSGAGMWGSQNGQGVGSQGEHQHYQLTAHFVGSDNAQCSGQTLGVQQSDRLSAERQPSTQLSDSLNNQLGQSKEGSIGLQQQGSQQLGTRTPLGTRPSSQYGPRPLVTNHQLGTRTGSPQLSSGLAVFSPQSQVSGGACTDNAWQDEVSELKRLVNQELAEMGAGVESSEDDEDSPLPFYPLRPSPSHLSQAPFRYGSKRGGSVSPFPSFRRRGPPSRTSDIEQGSNATSQALSHTSAPQHESAGRPPSSEQRSPQPGSRHVNPHPSISSQEPAGKHADVELSAPAPHPAMRAAPSVLQASPDASHPHAQYMRSNVGGSTTVSISNSAVPCTNTTGGAEAATGGSSQSNPAAHPAPHAADLSSAEASGNSKAQHSNGAPHAAPRSHLTGQVDAPPSGRSSTHHTPSTSRAVSRSSTLGGRDALSRKGSVPLPQLPASLAEYEPPPQRPHRLQQSQLQTSASTQALQHQPQHQVQQGSGPQLQRQRQQQQLQADPGHRPLLHSLQQTQGVPDRHHQQQPPSQLQHQAVPSQPQQLRPQQMQVLPLQQQPSTASAQQHSTVVRPEATDPAPTSAIPPNSTVQGAWLPATEALNTMDDNDAPSARHAWTSSAAQQRLLQATLSRADAFMARRPAPTHASVTMTTTTAGAPAPAARAPATLSSSAGAVVGGEGRGRSGSHRSSNREREGANVSAEGRTSQGDSSATQGSKNAGEHHLATSWRSIFAGKPAAPTSMQPVPFARGPNAQTGPAASHAAQTPAMLRVQEWVTAGAPAVMLAAGMQAKPPPAPPPAALTKVYLWLNVRAPPPSPASSSRPSSPASSNNSGARRSPVAAAAGHVPSAATQGGSLATAGPSPAATQPEPSASPPYPQMHAPLEPTTTRQLPPAAPSNATPGGVLHPPAPPCPPSAPDPAPPPAAPIPFSLSPSDLPGPSRSPPTQHISVLNLDSVQPGAAQCPQAAQQLAPSNSQEAAVAVDMQQSEGADSVGGQRLVLEQPAQQGQQEPVHADAVVLNMQKTDLTQLPGQQQSGQQQQQQQQQPKPHVPYNVSLLLRHLLMPSNSPPSNGAQFQTAQSLLHESPPISPSAPLPAALILPTPFIASSLRQGLPLLRDGHKPRDSMLSPLTVVTEGMPLPSGTLQMHHVGTELEAPLPQETTHVLSMDSGTQSEQLPPQLKRLSKQQQVTGHRRVVSLGTLLSQASGKFGRMPSLGSFAGMKQALSMDSMSSQQGSNQGSSLARISVQGVSPHKAQSSVSSIEFNAMGVKEVADDVDVLPAWWSVGSQTSYDPVAVERKRMARHKRSVSRDSVQVMFSRNSMKPTPDQLANMFCDFYGGNDFAGETIFEQAPNENEKDAHDKGSSLGMPSFQVVPRISSAPAIQGHMLEAGVAVPADASVPSPPRTVLSKPKDSTKAKTWNKAVLARPSVRQLKTVNTFDEQGYVVSVNAQQYAVLVCDVNQTLWTNEPMWQTHYTEEGQGVLSWFLPLWLRNWVMSNYAVHVRALYDEPASIARPKQASGSLGLQQLRKGRPAGTSGMDEDAEMGLLSDVEQGGMGERRAKGPVAEGGEMEQGWSSGPSKGASAAEMGVLRDVEQRAGGMGATRAQGAAVESRAEGLHDHRRGVVSAVNGQGHHRQEDMGQSGLGLGLEHVSAGGSTAGAEAGGNPGWWGSNGRGHAGADGRCPEGLLMANPLADLHSSGDFLQQLQQQGGLPAEHISCFQNSVFLPQPGDVGAAHTFGSSSPETSASTPAGKEVAAARQNEAADKGGAGESKEAVAGPTCYVIAGLKSGETEAHKLACVRWNFLRRAVFDGRVRSLLLSKDYSLVTATFARLFPKDFDRALPVFNHNKVDQLLMRLDYHHAMYSKAYIKLKRMKKRPRHRTGCCGLFGPKVDSLVHHLQRVHELEEEVKKARVETVAEGRTPSWFVLFKTQQAAAIASQSVIQPEDNHEFTVHPAPGPEEVNWQALNFSYRQRTLRFLIVQPLLLLLIAIPVGLVSGALMQLDYLFCPVHRCQSEDGTIHLSDGHCAPGQVNLSNNVKKAFTWDWYCADKHFFTAYLSKFITGWIPSLLVTLWQELVLPIVMIVLVQASGSCVSLSQVDEKVAMYIFWHTAAQVFLGGVLGSAFAQQINQFFQGGPAAAVDILGTYLPASSNFFLTYLLFQIFVLIPFRLLIPHLSVRMFIFRRWVFRCSSAALSPREKAFLYTPTSVRMGFEVGMSLLMFLIVMSFSILAPVIPVVGVAFMCASWVLWRHAVLYIYVRKYESGGLMWPFIFKIMLFIYCIFGIFVACVLAVKRAYVQALLLLFLVPLFLYKFNKYAYFRFARSTLHVPLRLANGAPPAQLDARCYIPPPMNERSVGWHPEWMKPWTGWNIPCAYSVT